MQNQDQFEITTNNSNALHIIHPKDRCKGTVCERSTAVLSLNCSWRIHHEILMSLNSDVFAVGSLIDFLTTKSIMLCDY